MGGRLLPARQEEPHPQRRPPQRQHERRESDQQRPGAQAGHGGAGERAQGRRGGQHEDERVAHLGGCVCVQGYTPQCVVAHSCSGAVLDRSVVPDGLLAMVRVVVVASKAVHAAPMSWLVVLPVPLIVWLYCLYRSLYAGRARVMAGA